jgi:hypothetical protein
VSTKLRIFNSSSVFRVCAFMALAATVCAPVCVSAAPPAAAIVIYYSFDSPPASAVLTSMQTEVAKIFDPTRLSLDWRPVDGRGGEVDSELVVVRFRGSCTANGWQSPASPRATNGGYSLADSKTSDGQVLPFTEVDCGALRSYLGGERFADPATVLGKAMGRVLSHEIYHILTASIAHAHSGVARAEHSRNELTAATFAFGKAETDWLKDWSARSRLVAVASAGAADGNAVGAESEAGER